MIEALGKKWWPTECFGTTVYRRRIKNGPIVYLHSCSTCSRLAAFPYSLTKGIRNGTMRINCLCGDGHHTLVHMKRESSDLPEKSVVKRLI